MPSVVYGPGKHEGQAADLPPRPTSLWECLADQVEGMDVHQLRRVMMLILRVTIGVRLEDIGRTFELHKGHVSREIDRAAKDVCQIVQAAGLDLKLGSAVPNESAVEMRQKSIALSVAEWSAMRAAARESGFSLQKQSRIWLLAGGLEAALKRKRQEAIDDVELEE